MKILPFAHIRSPHTTVAVLFQLKSKRALFEISTQDQVCHCGLIENTT